MDSTTKPGPLTTEFWGKNMVQIVALAAMGYAIYSGHSISPEQQATIVKIGMGVLGAVESAYSISRGIAKGGITK